MNLKSVITLLIVIALIVAFEYSVITYINDAMANNIVSQFMPIAANVIGFYIGYQTAKVVSNKEK